MLKKTIQHKDLDGNDVETDAYFNLTKAEAIELNIRNDLEVIGRSRNNNEIMDTFKRILQASYGVRTGNGQFIKEGFAAFAASEAYSELFMEIWQNPEYASAFIRGILPAEALEAAEGQQTNQSTIPAHMANHPSMQGHLKKQERTIPEPKAPVNRNLDNFDTTPAVQPPAIAESSDTVIVDSQGYKDYLAYKAATGVQVPKQFDEVSDELI